MDDDHRSKASSPAESPNTEKEGSKTKKTGSMKMRRVRTGFSDTLNFDVKALLIDEEATPNCSTSAGVLEECARSGASESPSNYASTSDSDCQPGEGHQPQWRNFLRFVKKGSPLRFAHPPKTIPKTTKRTVKRIKEDLIPAMNSPSTSASLDQELYYFKASWINFSYSQLEAATNNFSQECLIGMGGYAEVYKGKMEDGKYVAIKRLTRGNQEEMTADFLSELGIIVHVDHPNIARLIGYGVEGGMFLVLQLSPHGSLSSILYGPREKLAWSIRYNIALGTADGLRYLHEDCQRRIIHRDIKAANILLLDNYEPQVSDFGLAKWLPDQWTHHTVDKIEGTFGYLPPEFFMHGIVDEKTDVFAYGVLLLELITGRQALDSSQKSLVMWAKPLLSVDKMKELVDPVLGDAYDEQQMKILVLTAASCIDQSAVQRPNMSEVVRTLKGEEGSMQYIMERQKSKLRRTYSVELFDAEEYNSTKLLNEMNRKSMEAMLGLSPCNSFQEERIQS